MTWLVFGVSCLLVLAGAVSIISGAPIIQLERGWAEVISGTVALSSGGVVFALAGILMRLEAIRNTMAARSLPVPAESVVVPAAVTPSSPSEPDPVAMAPVPLPEPVAAATAVPAPDDEARTQTLWKRVKRPDPRTVAAERPDAEALRQHGFPDRVVPDEPTLAPPAADAPVLVPAHPVPVEASVPPVAAPTAAATDRETGQIGWLERSLFQGRPARSSGVIGLDRIDPPAVVPQSENRSDLHEERPDAPQTEAPASRLPLFPAPDPTAAAEPAPTPDFGSEQHEGTSVIGRYQAGSASYIMYSDGTIEVETESGETHRFGSMDELKGFIAQQDTAVS